MIFTHLLNYAIAAIQINERGFYAFGNLSETCHAFLEKSKDGFTFAAHPNPI
jgi:hypothetical protein